MTRVEEIIAQVETLTEEERAMIAEAASRSLHQSEHEFSAAWKKEIARRVQSLGDFLAEVESKYPSS